MNSKRFYYLDILRIIACLAVILIHTSAPFAVQEVGSFNYWIGHSVDSTFRFGVPVFVMISGALLLDEQYDCPPKKLVKKIILLLVFYVFWSLLYALIYDIFVPSAKGIDINFTDFITRFFSGHLHLWFIPMLIGLYLLVPVLRLFVKKENKAYIKYILWLSFIFIFIIQLIFRILSFYGVKLLKSNLFFERMDIALISGLLPYFLLGWYLHNFQLKKGIRILAYILGAISVPMIIFGSYAISVTGGNKFFFYEENVIFVLFISIALFVLMKQIVPQEKKYDCGDNFVVALSNCSLGVYGMHVGFCYMMARIIDRSFTDNALITIPIVFYFSAIVSYLISYVISRIPLAKHLVS